MKNKLIATIKEAMSGTLSLKQMEILDETLMKCLDSVEISDRKTEREFVNADNKKLLALFISSKRVEGCSEKSLKYYSTTIDCMLQSVDKKIEVITTNDLRFYLANYQDSKKSSKVTIDNIRRIFSTFFSWLEDEDYILKSPVRRIRKIKTGKIVKETLTDENLEVLRDSCLGIRDLAMIDLLASTGMRVGELVRNKRTDDNPALFVSLSKPHNRLSISGVEVRLRKLGQIANINKVHPHKFRRTLATMAIDKGMPIEQVQKLLGHVKIDTTMHYAMVNQSNVKIAHRKFIG